jgi:hypothetical protein
LTDMKLTLYWCPICKRFHSQVQAVATDFYLERDEFFIDFKNGAVENAECGRDGDYDSSELEITCPEGHYLVKQEEVFAFSSLEEAIKSAKKALKPYTLILELPEERVIYKGDKVPTNYEKFLPSFDV